jgi:hypothetical protein
MGCILSVLGAINASIEFNNLQSLLAPVTRTWIHDPADGALARLEDVPFNAEAGEVIFAPGAAYLRTLDTLTQCLELVAVTEADERVIGKYTFNHHRYTG